MLLKQLYLKVIIVTAVILALTACGEDATANSLFHQSYQVIFRRTY